MTDEGFIGRKVVDIYGHLYIEFILKEGYKKPEISARRAKDLNKGNSEAS